MSTLNRLPSAAVVAVLAAGLFRFAALPSKSKSTHGEPPRSVKMVDSRHHSAVVPIRIYPQLKNRLDEFVAYAAAEGATGVTRSSVIRASLEAFLDAAETEIRALDPAHRGANR